MSYIENPTKVESLEKPKREFGPMCVYRQDYLILKASFNEKETRSSLEDPCAHCDGIDTDKKCYLRPP